MTSYREDCNHAKLVREGIIEPRPVSGKNGKTKEVVLEYPWAKTLFDWLNDGRKWAKWKAYRTEAKALTAAKLMRRWSLCSSCIEFRLRPPEAQNENTRKNMEPDLNRDKLVAAHARPALHNRHDVRGAKMKILSIVVGVIAFLVFLGWASVGFVEDAKWDRFVRLDHCVEISPNQFKCDHGTFTRR